MVTWRPISDVTHLSHLLQPRKAQFTLRQEGEDLEHHSWTWVARLPQTVGAGRGSMDQRGAPLLAVAPSPGQGQPFDCACHQPSYRLAH